MTMKVAIANFFVIRKGRRAAFGRLAHVNGGFADGLLLRDEREATSDRDRPRRLLEIAVAHAAKVGRFIWNAGVTVSSLLLCLLVLLSSSGEMGLWFSTAAGAQLLTDLLRS